MKIIKLIACFILLGINGQAMAAQTDWNDGDTGLAVKTALKANDTEIYNILSGTAPTLGHLEIGGTGDSWLEMNNNTTLVDDYTGKYGWRFYNGVLQQIINGTASSIGSGGSGYVTPPTYSDETCTTGQYSWDASYFYGCESTDAWDRYPVTWAAWSNPTPTTPTLSTFTTATTGILSTLVFSAPVTATDFTGFSTVLPNHVLTYTGGDTTNTLTFSHDTIYSTATDNPTGSFTSPGATGISAVTGGALLADFTGATVDNQSTQTPSTSEILGITTIGGSTSSRLTGTLYAFHVGQVTASGLTLSTINIYDVDSTNGTLYVGIYSGSTTVPSTLVVDLGEFDQLGGSTWTEFVDAASTALPSGVEYWIAATPDANSHWTTAHTAGTSVTYSGLHTYGPLPVAFPTGTAVNTQDNSVWLEAN